jgi:hypothetical protein
MIVCIASKGRPNTKTHLLLKPHGYKVFHFVEPQDFDLYATTGDKDLVNIGKNDQGIAFVRNAMLDWCRNNGMQWAWFCDDDITGFGYATLAGKTIKKDASLLRHIEEIAYGSQYELHGMNYQQHAWREKKDYSINKNFTDCCVLVNVSKVTWSYDASVNAKEDRDFCAQAVTNGFGVLRHNRIWFACPNVGTNAGGLQEMYAAKKDEQAARKMVAKWHPYAKLIDKNGRIEVKIDLKSIALANGKKVF